MSTTNAILRNSIATLEEEIDRLATMRIKLVGILGDEDTDQPVRKSRKATTKASTRKVKATKNGNGHSNGNGESRKDQIAALLDSDMTPREVADELGIAPQYVYHVRRQLS